MKTKVYVLFSILFLTLFTSCNKDISNQAPEILTKHIKINLNTATAARNSGDQSIGFIEAFDAEGDVLTFEILSQNPENVVSVNESTGELFLTNDGGHVGEGAVIEIIELRVNVSDGNLSTEDFIIIDLEEEE